jgi:hypothetical protein
MTVRCPILILSATALMLELAAGPATAPAPRSPDAILDDMRDAQRALRAAVTSPADLGDPTKRAAIAPRAIPPLKRLIADGREMDANWAHVPPGRPRLTELRFRAILAALGDPESVDLLSKQAADPVAAEQARGRSGQLLAQWVQSPGNAVAQAGIVDQLAAVCAAHPDSDELASVIDAMAGSAATPELHARLRTLLGPMTSPTAKLLRMRSATRPAGRPPQ